MNIIVLGPSYKEYGAAAYQREFLDAIKKISTNFYHYYKQKEINTDEVIKECKFKPNVILYNHGWLEDSTNSNGICLYKVKGNWGSSEIKHVLIINKEYSRLREKIEYINSRGFDLIVTHYHKKDIFKELHEKNKLFFLPLAYNPNDIKKELIKDISQREYDLYFSGILQNPHHSGKQGDLRIRIQKELFYCIGDFPIYKRYNHKNLKIYWKPFYSSWIKNKLSNIIHGKLLDRSEYKKMICNSKCVIHTSSPIGIISTRVFEILGCGAIGVFSYESEASELFIKGREYLEFQNIKELIEYLYNIKDSTNNNIFQDIAKRGYMQAKSKHTWANRVNELQLELENLQR